MANYSLLDLMLAEAFLAGLAREAAQAESAQPKNLYVLQPDFRAWRQIKQIGMKENMVGCLEITRRDSEACFKVQRIFMDMAKKYEDVPFLRAFIDHFSTFDELRLDVGGVRFTPTIVVIFFGANNTISRATYEGLDNIMAAMQTGHIEVVLKDLLGKREKLKMMESQMAPGVRNQMPGRESSVREAQMSTSLKKLEDQKEKERMKEEEEKKGNKGEDERRVKQKREERMSQDTREEDEELERMMKNTKLSETSSAKVKMNCEEVLGETSSAEVAMSCEEVLGETSAQAMTYKEATPQPCSASSNSTLKLPDFSLRNLTILKWTDKTKLRQEFRLRDKISSRWYDIGMFLELSLNQLHGIKSKHNGDFDMCFLDVIQVWVEKGSDDYPASWEGMLSLLKDLALNSTAENLKSALDSITKLQ